MQLDLFLDGRQSILVNELVAALLEGRVTGARTGLDRLRQENPDHPDVAAFERLVRSMAEGPALPSISPRFFRMYWRLVVEARAPAT